MHYDHLLNCSSVERQRMDRFPLTTDWSAMMENELKFLLYIQHHSEGHSFVIPSCLKNPQSIFIKLTAGRHIVRQREMELSRYLSAADGNVQTSLSSRVRPLPGYPHLLPAAVQHGRSPELPPFCGFPRLNRYHCKSPPTSSEPVCG